MSNTALRIEHLSKYYQLGVINTGTLHRDMQSWFYKKLGKEDPNSKIGSKENKADGFWALRDINFEIKKGDRIGLIGRNGAGKSTLLKMISQISAPTEGRILINGKVASLLEVGTGFNPELTGRENIYLNGAILGMKKREIDRKVDEIIAFSEIEKHIDTPVKRYSSGMYVRLAFAVAAHLDSDILIADEVLAVGDAEFQKKALGKMNELSTGQGRTVIFVSHNMSAVKNLCNKGIILEHGTIKRQDNNIEDSINYYLGIEDADKEQSISWYNDGTVLNEYFCFRKIEFQNMNGEKVISSLDYEMDYKVYIEIEVYKKSPFIIDCWFPVFKGTEQIASFSIPDATYDRGIYKFEINICKEMFLPGQYVIAPAATLKEHAWIVNYHNFEIIASFVVECGNNNKFIVHKR